MTYLPNTRTNRRISQAVLAACLLNSLYLLLSYSFNA